MSKNDFGDEKPRKVVLPENYFPIEGTTGDGEQLILVKYDDSFQDELFDILTREFSKEYTSCIYDSSLTEDDMKREFLSYEAVVCLDATNKEVLGAFHLKPAYPCRSSHIANGGFIVREEHRHKGIGKFLIKKFLQLAKDLEFEMCYLDLVNMKDMVTFRMLVSAQFQCCGKLDNAVKVKEDGNDIKLETVQMHHDLKGIERSVCMEWFF